jgi:flagellar hook protein FlgE
MKSTSVFGKLFILFNLLILASCSITDRHYNSGYNIEWNGNKNARNSNNSNRQNTCSMPKKNFNSELINSDYNLKDSTISPINQILNSEKQTVESKKEHKESKNYFDKKGKRSLVNKHSFKIDSSIQKKISFPKKTNEPDSALKIAGWILLSLGFIIFWFLSILLGSMFLILGLLFVLVGSNKSKMPRIRNESNKKNEFVEVVYLKNGGIVRGVIIEQIPNVQLKIQTMDQNVFVFKMDEIEKITKEISK